MSSSRSAGSDAEKCYFCHQCNWTFTYTGSGLTCAHCHGDFVQELDLLSPSPSPNPLPDRDFHFTYWTPPASKAAVESLLDVVVIEGMLSIDKAQCSVCMDTFQMGAVVKKMSCSHIYHKDCILPWLELHNSCPICSYELPMNDPDYEHYKAPQTVSGEGEGNSSVTGGATDHEDPTFDTDG